MSSSFEIAPEPVSPTRPDGDLDLPEKLAEFGLEGDAIREELRDLFQRFGWDAGERRPVAPGSGEG